MIWRWNRSKHNFRWFVDLGTEQDSGILLCIFLCDKLLNPFWQRRKTSTWTTWQHSRRTYFLSAVNHEPGYYSISWDIKLFMLVCAKWFARNKQWNCGYWKTSNIRQFPHSDWRCLHRETEAITLTCVFLFCFHHINHPETHRCLKYEHGVQSHGGAPC